jgi:hypothetical protein
MTMTTNCTVTPNLAAALVKAQAQMEAVAKGSTNAFHRYKYASSEDIIDASRDVLTANGLSFTVESAKYTAMTGEAVWNAVGLLGMEFVLEHSSGEQRRMSADIPVCPEKGRPLDKALFAARTEGLGYGLRDLLLIPRKNAEDISGRRERDDGPPEHIPQVPASAPKQSAPRVYEVKQQAPVDDAQFKAEVQKAYNVAVNAGKQAASAKNGDAWQAARKGLIQACQRIGMADVDIKDILERFKASTAQTAPAALPPVKSVKPREPGDDTDAEQAAAIDRGAA